MSSALFALLAVAAGLAFRVPTWVYGLSVAFGLLVATFRVWKDERARAEAAERERDNALGEVKVLERRAEEQAAADDATVRKLTLEQLWLLSLIRKYGARRAMVVDVVTNSHMNAVWIGATAVSSRELVDLINTAADVGLVVLDPKTQHYTIPGDVVEGLSVALRRGVKPAPPAGLQLFGARDGKAVEFDV